MRNIKTIHSVQGAGLAFPLAALLFVLTWNWRFFFLIPAGAAAGFLLGRKLSRAFSPAAVRQPSQVGRLNILKCVRARISRFKVMLLAEGFSVRFFSLLAVGFLIFMLAWIVGYTVFPEGALRPGVQVQMARGGLEAVSPTLVEEAIKIFRVNLYPVFIILVGNLLIRINRVPLGYLAALFNLGMYGLLVGTNSFAIPYAERMAPSLAILGRSGPYEMIALLILAASTGRWSLFEIKRLFFTTPERVVPRPRVALADFGGIVLGMVLLAAANGAEAAMILEHVR